MKDKETIKFGITLSILLTMLIGMSYAYFRANINGEESVSTIVAESGEMDITYENNSSNIIANGAVPGWEVVKNFTISGKNTAKANKVNPDNNMYYKIGIVVDENTFSKGALIYSLTSEEVSNGKKADNKSGKIGNEGITYIGDGYFTETSTYVDHKYHLAIGFPETGKDQSNDKGKSFAAHVVVEYGKLELISEYIAKLEKNNADINGLIIDNTEDKNLRYSGSNEIVKNYILFNDEIWRIIGTFNVKNNDTGKNEQMIKIVREEPIQNSDGDYGFNWNAVKTGTNYNDWTTATLQKYLNETYYPSMSDDARSQIANVEWSIRNTTNEIGTLESYNYEIKNGSVTTGNKATWNGKIALMYPSDYGYASTHLVCRYNMSDYESILIGGYCRNNNWLYDSSQKKKNGFYLRGQKK